MAIEFSGAPRKQPVRLGTVQTVDAETGEVIETRRNAGTLLGPGPDVCQECGVDHPHDQPHNQQSLYYQMAFAAKHGRYPTWTDAMAHCSDQVRADWRKRCQVLGENGIVVPPDLFD